MVWNYCTKGCVLVEQFCGMQGLVVLWSQQRLKKSSKHEKHI